MENFLADMKALNVQKRKVAFLENGTWAATSGKQMAEQVAALKEMTVISDTLTVKSALKEDQYASLEELADKIVASME